MIPNWLASYVNESDAKSIEDAVIKAEATTSGEIVPVIVRQASVTNSLFAFVYLILFVVFSLSVDLIFSEFNTVTGLIKSVSFITGLVFLIPISLFLSRLGLVIRLLVHPIDLDHQARQRAVIEFYNLGLNKTDGSTGVMIFISMIDHEVVILGDKAINDKISEDQWVELKNQMLFDLKKRTIAEAFNVAIKSCGAILEKHFPKEANNPNELRNKLVIID